MHDTDALASRLAQSGATAAAGDSVVPKPALIILHQEQSSPGQVGNVLRTQGVPLDIRRPRFGESLPATLANHSGVVIFGGPMSANDTEDYVKLEIGLVELALKEERPFLGLCLGAQMMAAALGAKVCMHPQEHVEIGYHSLTPLPSATIGGEWPRTVFQWHKEGFDLPAGSVPLASADNWFTNQAFRYGRAAFGFQFHPEITYAMVSRWSVRGAQRLALPGAQQRTDQLASHLRYAPEVHRWLDRFIAEWLKL
jgi:GMP synthase (glutamine-hydrolysing)